MQQQAHGPLEHPDHFYMQASEGWLMLGDHLEALRELEWVSSAAQLHPAVLYQRWRILERQRKWDECLSVSQALLDRFPKDPNAWITHANTIYFSGNPREAFLMLHPKLKEFPKVEAVPYNLACYKCQSGDMEEAVGWLKHALQLGHPAEIRARALSDTDLQPLWTNIVTQWDNWVKETRAKSSNPPLT